MIQNTTTKETDEKYPNLGYKNNNKKEKKRRDGWVGQAQKDPLVSINQEEETKSEGLHPSENPLSIRITATTKQPRLSR